MLGFLFSAPMTPTPAMTAMSGHTRPTSFSGLFHAHEVTAIAAPVSQSGNGNSTPPGPSRITARAARRNLRVVDSRSKAGCELPGDERPPAAETRGRSLGGRHGRP